MAKKITKARLQRLSLLQLKALLVLIQMLINTKTGARASGKRKSHRELAAERRAEAVKTYRKVKGKVPPWLKPYLFKKGHGAVKALKKRHKKSRKKG